MLIYICPSDRKYACSWEGPSEDVLHHFEEEHDDLLHFNDTFNIDLHTSSENRLFFIEEEIYLAQIKCSGKKIEMSMRYLGPKKIAERITYNILVKVNSDLCHPNYICVNENGGMTVDLSEINSDLDDVNSVSCTLNINKEIDYDDDVFITSEVSEREEQISHSTTRKYSLDRSQYAITTEVSLSRSKTISLEEVKRRNLKRAKSTLSLGAIREIDTDSAANCTECGVILSPPIFLCPCHHSFCLNCQKAVCKICLEKVTYERNIYLEERFNKFLVPCRYKKNGCPEKLIYNEISNHVNNCTFCDYQCPMAGCHFEGQFKHICNHFRLIHGTTKILESFILVFQNIPEAFLVNEEKGIFHCYVQYLDDTVKWKAIFCGPKERRFFCELKFKEGKLKQPVLLDRSENVYSVAMSLQELKRMKIKAKNAVLTIAC